MPENRPGERATRAGDYEELNVFGSKTGRVVFVDVEDTLPSAPRGFTWFLKSDWPTASELAGVGNLTGQPRQCREQSEVAQ
jgi:hypothetical protein